MYEIMKYMTSKIPHTRIRGIKNDASGDLKTFHHDLNG
jgi:hypothetical protein